MTSAQLHHSVSIMHHASSDEHVHGHLRRHAAKEEHQFTSIGVKRRIVLMFVHPYFFVSKRQIFSSSDNKNIQGHGAVTIHLLFKIRQMHYKWTIITLKLQRYCVPVRTMMHAKQV